MPCLQPLHKKMGQITMLYKSCMVWVSMMAFHSIPTKYGSNYIKLHKCEIMSKNAY